MPKNKWRMARQCPDCPFAESGPSRPLRKSLRHGMFAEIKTGLRRGAHFLCHQTTGQTGDGSNLVCAGAIEWQAKRGIGIVADYVQVCERLDAYRKSRLTHRGD